MPEDGEFVGIPKTLRLTKVGNADEVEYKLIDNIARENLLLISKNA